MIPNNSTVKKINDTCFVIDQVRDLYLCLNITKLEVYYSIETSSFNMIKNKLRLLSKHNNEDEATNKFNEMIGR